MPFLVLLLLLLSHTALWVGVYNRFHAIPFPRRVLHIIDKVPVIFVFAVWSAAGIELALDHHMAERWLKFIADHAWLTGYACICSLFGLVCAAGWFRRTLWPHPALLQHNRSTCRDVARELGKRPVGGRMARLFDWLPGNDMFKLEINEKCVKLPRLPAALDQLSIVHLSDLHFTGQITREFFDFVVGQANELAGDLIVVTGDIVDEADCLAWLPDTLGRLRAPHGVWVILGNHDWRQADVPGMRRQMSSLGLVEIGGRAVTLELHGARLVVAGNEWPWFGPRPAVPAREANELRLLLSHSPDQIAWARRNDFDLMLAGHNHGGQIRVPIVGPMITPSLYGVKYAGGLFYVPPTLMHVSRGISGEEPVRFRCAPELTKLVLRNGRSHG